MSKTGPSLLRCPRGYAYAKFNGKKQSFGRYDDPKAHEASVVGRSVTDHSPACEINIRAEVVVRAWLEPGQSDSLG